MRPEFRDGIKTATLDPVRGYAKAIHDEFPDAVQVLGAFHVVKLATIMVDELRRRVQQATIGPRGRKSEARRRGHLPLLMSVEGPFSKSEDTNEPDEPRPC
ncbi:MAG: transposase [Specibacter sp.]